MKILKELKINAKQRILVIDDEDKILMYILDNEYMHMDLCFGFEKDKFNFTDDELIDLSKKHFKAYYKDIEILEEYWNNHDE